MLKNSIYISAFIVIFAAINILIGYGHFKVLPFISYIVFISSVFIVLLIIINSLYKSVFNKLFLSFMFLLFIVSTYAEAINYRITNMSFYEAFWDLLSWSFFIEVIKTYKIESLCVFISIILLNIIIWKVLNNPLKKYAYKKDIFISLMLSVIFIILLFNSSSLGRITKSYITYNESKKVRKFDYLVQQPNKNDIVVSSVDNPKNVVHIILESYADFFTNNDVYPNLTPNLNKLRLTGVDLAQLKQLPYVQYSEAGNLMSNKGRMPYVGDIKNDNDIGLTYVLKKAGYYNVFMRGARKLSGGFEFSNIYSQEQGVDEFWYLEKFEENNYNFDRYIWGLSDESLFKIALDKYKLLQSKNQPFYLGLFTLDTHIDQEISKACKNIINDNKILRAVSCTDFIVGKFIEDLSKLPNFDNTLIVIHSDHMPYFVTSLIPEGDDKQFGLILNSNKKPFIQNKETYIFDMPQTIISNLGIKTNAKFLLGEDITTNFIREQKTKDGSIKNGTLKNIEMNFSLGMLTRALGIN